MADARRAEIRLRLPRLHQTVALVRRLVRHVLEDLSMPVQFVGEVELAVGEACANAVRHARADERYEVLLSLEASGFEVRITDLGWGFDPAAVPFPAPSAPGGRGLLIMRAVMDEVLVRSSPGQPTEVRLRRRFPPRHRPGDVDRISAVLSAASDGYGASVAACGGSIEAGSADANP